MNWSQRSSQKELLDAEDVPWDDLQKNMQELDAINKLTGGHATSIFGLKTLLKQANRTHGKLIIAEIGCGDGNNIRALSTCKWLEKYDLHFIGIDMKQACVEAGKEKAIKHPTTWICSPYHEVNWAESQRPHIIFSSLFAHHFSREELQDQLEWMCAQSQLGFFINDLHRHPIAFGSIKMLSSLFSNSYLVKNDAPISVLRSFRKRDWLSSMKSFPDLSYKLFWRWAFRYLLVVWH